MYFWLKLLHITAVSIWFTGLFLLPRLFIAHAREGPEAVPRLRALGRTLYFGITTPAAVTAIALGLVLIAFGGHGAWLVVKLTLVSCAVLLHVYCGLLLADLDRGHARHGPMLYRALNWMPLLLVLAIAALSGVQPDALPPFGGP